MHVVVQLMLNVPQQTAGSNSKENGLHLLIPKLFLH